MAVKIEIKQVSDAKALRLREFLSRVNMTGHEQDSGTAEGLCCKVKFAYDSEKNLLLLEPIEMADHLSHEKLERTVRFAMAAESTCGPQDAWPKEAGVYNYVEPFINNKSGGVLTFSSNDIPLGTLVIKNAKINADQSLQAFDARSTRGSAMGFQGKVTYTFADGSTSLNISYLLNTVYTYSFTAGLSGKHVEHYTATLTCTEVIAAGYAYMWPVITLAPA